MTTWWWIGGLFRYLNSSHCATFSQLGLSSFSLSCFLDSPWTWRLQVILLHPPNLSLLVWPRLLLPTSSAIRTPRPRKGKPCRKPRKWLSKWFWIFIRWPPCNNRHWSKLSTIEFNWPPSQTRPAVTSHGSQNTSHPPLRQQNTHN